MSVSLQDLADNSPTDRNFRKLAQLVIDTGGQNVGIRFGNQVLTFPGGGVFTSISTVTHGLGRTPKVVVATANLAAVTLFAFTYAPGATTFNLQGWTPNAAPGAGTTESVSWVAIG
jgi:hypothetical protein